MSNFESSNKGIGLFLQPPNNLSFSLLAPVSVIQLSCKFPHFLMVLASPTTHLPFVPGCPAALTLWHKLNGHDMMLELVWIPMTILNNFKSNTYLNDSWKEGWKKRKQEKRKYAIIVVNHQDIHWLILKATLTVSDYETSYSTFDKNIILSRDIKIRYKKYLPKVWQIQWEPQFFKNFADV